MVLAWTVEFAADAKRDLSLIFDHLFETYKELGEADIRAFDHAATRIRDIQASALTLGSNPFRGTRREAYGTNLRNITLNKAVIWFHIDEGRGVVRILAFFFGGQNHTRHMLRRLLDR